jgi:hypothetical protein
LLHGRLTVADRRLQPPPVAAPQVAAGKPLAGVGEPAQLLPPVAA